MEGDGLEVEEFDESGGEQVLRGVLLHVVQAAGPVNLAVDGAGGDFGCGVVDYLMGIAWVGGAGRGVIGRCGSRAGSVNDFYYLRGAQGAEVVRLAAGGGVERRFIKDNFPAGAVGRAGDYRGVEFAEERVVVVEPVRQVSSLSIQGENNIEAVTAIGTSAAKAAATCLRSCRG